MGVDIRVCRKDLLAELCGAMAFFEERCVSCIEVSTQTRNLLPCGNFRFAGLRQLDFQFLNSNSCCFEVSARADFGLTRSTSDEDQRQPRASVVATNDFGRDPARRAARIIWLQRSISGPRQPSPQAIFAPAKSAANCQRQLSLDFSGRETGCRVGSCTSSCPIAIRPDT